MTKEENLKFKEDIIKKKFKESLGYELDLENPKTFNEKLQWLKLYYNDPLMTKCADKYLAREYIKETIGEEYLIPLLGVWRSPDEIDFDSLPNQFVLKVNWGWQQNIIVKDKTKLNIHETKEKLKYWLEPFSNNYYALYEWQYKNIEPKIIGEKYIEDINGQLYDYKVLCFNGNPKYIQVDTDRFINHRRLIYDLNWNRMNIVYCYDSQEKYINKPNEFYKMFELSSLLSNKFPFVRIDFFCTQYNLFIGEFTFNPENGTGKFEPQDWDYKFGELLELPKEKKIEYDYIDVDRAVEQLCDLEKTAITYKKYEENFKLYKNKYERLKSKSFALFGFFNEEDYFTLIILGIKIVFKKNNSRTNM